MSVDNGKLLAYLAAKGEILSTHYSEERVRVHCRIPQKYLGRIDDTNITIQDRDSSDSDADISLEPDVTDDPDAQVDDNFRDDVA